MKRARFLFLFFIAFSLEVRVRASATLTLPENCLGQVSPCSLKVGEEKWSFESGNLRLRAEKGTILTVNSTTQEWTLVAGGLWVQNAPSVRIKTLSAEAEGSSGQYWVFSDKDRFLFRNITAKLTLILKDQSKMEVPRGFEVWVGGVDSEARVERGMVQPIDLKQHLKSWQALYPGSRSQFISEVQDLKGQWADLVEKSGDIYKKVAERKLALVSEEQRQAQERQKKKELERRRLRENYHRRVFEY